MTRVLRYIGSAVAIGFVGIVLWQGIGSLPAIDFLSGRIWSGLAGGFILYCTSQFIGAAAWLKTLRIYDVALPNWRAESQLLVSQIGKYIPGNVAHLFGRIVLARADGVSTAATAAAMMLEVGFLLTAGFVVVGIIFLIDPFLLAQLIQDLPSNNFGWLVALAILLLFVSLIIGQILIWRRSGRPALKLKLFIWPMLLHGCNFVLLGASLWCVVIAIAPMSAPTLLLCTSVFTCAWVAGFLVPGAPGGVGVRDGIIALGLGLMVGPGVGLGIAVAHRLISVLGDLAIFGIGVRLRRL